MMAVDAFIRGRGVDARRMLVPLLDHRNAQVRINAAKALLAVVPERARATLEALASNAPSIQRLDARMCLNHLDKGIFKPT
jgi:HEAT repeat protein